jgi:UDPglucose--hexose-1-phosphate uridylyltransferase
MTHELRKDPLLSRWVAVSGVSIGPSDYGLPHERPQADEPCPICSNGGVNEIASSKEGDRWLAKVIPDMRPVLITNGELGRKGIGMYDRMNSIGTNEIIVESPEHGKRPEELGPEQFKRILSLYKMRLAELGRDAKIRYVLIYKNSGERAGAKYSHPHSELLATPVIPRLIKAELDGAKHYFAYKERCIFCDINAEEQRAGERIIKESGNFIAFCPYAPKFPFEFWIVPKRHNCAFEEATDAETEDLSLFMTSLLLRMRAVLGEPSYNYYIHTAPSRIPRRNHWHTLGDDFHWHIEVIPRLTDSSGFELGSDFYVIATSPEDAAKYIKEA